VLDDHVSELGRLPGFPSSLPGGPTRSLLPVSIAFAERQMPSRGSCAGTRQDPRGVSVEGAPCGDELPRRGEVDRRRRHVGEASGAEPSATNWSSRHGEPVLLEGFLRRTPLRNRSGQLHPCCCYRSPAASLHGSSGPSFGRPRLEDSSAEGTRDEVHAARRWRSRGRGSVDLDDRASRDDARRKVEREIAPRGTTVPAHGRADAGRELRNRGRPCRGLTWTKPDRRSARARASPRARCRAGDSLIVVTPSRRAPPAASARRRRASGRRRGRRATGQRRQLPAVALERLAGQAECGGSTIPWTFPEGFVSGH